MPEEEESNSPKLIIPESEENKSQSRLLVPQSDQETESSSPKPQLVTPIDQAEEPQTEEPQIEEPQIEEPQTDSVKVVEMSPPTTEEGIIGQLPQPQEDDWMKDAYEQVTDADRAAEVINESGNEISSAEPNVEQSVEPIYQPPAEPVYQPPVELPAASSQMQPQLVPTPQLYAQQQVNPYQNVQYYQQAYSVPPSAGAYPYQQSMPTNVPPNQQVPVGQPRGTPGIAWGSLGLIVGAALGLLIFKFLPIDWAAKFRPDLVEKGKKLVIMKGSIPVQNQSVAPIAPVVPVPQQEEPPSEPDTVPDSDPESE